MFPYDRDALTWTLEEQDGNLGFSCFILAWKLVCSTHGFLGVAIHMSLGILDIYDLVTPPRGSHENMDHMSDDWI